MVALINYIIVTLTTLIMWIFDGPTWAMWAGIITGFEMVLYDYFTKHIECAH